MRRKKSTRANKDAKPLSAHEAGKFAARVHDTPSAPASSGENRRSQVTKREREILAFIGAGLTNVEISRQIRREVGTVEKHIENLYKNLGVHTRAEAVAWFLRAQIEECGGENARLRIEIQRLKRELAAFRAG